MRSILLLFVIISIAFAPCNGEVTYYIPAVVGDSGGLVEVTMTAATGPGNVYVTVAPNVGISTQQSIETAINYAKSMTNATTCDVYVNFVDKNGELIDGPSGGAAFGVMAYVLFNGGELRNDTIITGTIDRFGNVGPVGGLYEKANGAANIGARYFITPEEDIYETFLLKNIEEGLNLTILQANSMNEIIGFMTENKTIERVELQSKEREIPVLPYYDYSNIKDFESVANRMIDLEHAAASGMVVNDNSTSIVKDYFENEILRQNEILEKGYLFTAANEAFLNYINLLTIEKINEGDVDLPGKIREVENCLNEIERPGMTENNFEWIVGATLRENWARNKLESTKIDGLLEDEKYAAYNEIMYADAWCQVAKGLVEFAGDDGREINEDVWEKIANEKINEAKEIPELDEGLQERLDIAEEEYENKEYGAAIYDATFVIAQAQEMPEAPDFSILNETRNSLWGNVYQAHAIFFYLQNQTDSAYSTALLAKGLEEATAEMKGAIEKDREANLPYHEYALAFGLMLLFIVALIIFRRSHGTNSQGRRKTYRIGQKKG